MSATLPASTPGLISSAADVVAPAFSQENIYGNVIAESLERFNEAEQKRKEAETLAQNVMKNRHAISTAVLSLDYGKGGVVNNET